MRNVLGRVVEKIKTHSLRSKTIFFENRAIYEIMCGKTGPQITSQYGAYEFHAG